jgi:periplasmic protein TonB
MRVSPILLRPCVVVSVGLHALAFVTVALTSAPSTSASVEREPLWLSLAPSEPETPFQASEVLDADLSALPEIVVEPPGPSRETEPTFPVVDVDAVPETWPLDAPQEPQFAPARSMPELERLRANGRVAGRRRAVVAVRPPAPHPVAASQAAPRGDRGRLLSAPQPLATNRPAAYPYEARVRGWQGVATFLVTIRPDGTVAAAVLETSSGHPSLDRAAHDAVRGWRYTPPLTEGAPAPVTLRLPIVFRLH